MLGFPWFVWPVTLTTTAASTGLYLYVKAVSNDRPVGVRLRAAYGSALVFAVPSMFVLLGTKLGCNPDTGLSTRFDMPVVLVLLLFALAGVALWGLQREVGSSGRDWLLPLIVLGVGLPGFFVESLVGFSALALYCEHENPFILYVQAVLAVLLPAGIIAGFLGVRRSAR